MADVHLVRETEGEIAFAHPPAAGVVFAVIGGVFAAIGYFAIDDSVGAWVFTGVGLLFVAIGIGGAFWRHELRLDLNARRYSRLKGFWPSPKLREGGLEEIEGVALQTEERRSKDHTYTVWVVKLPFRGEEEPVSVHEARDEMGGYARAESLAKKLRVPLLDRTEMPERVTPWEKLDETVADRVAAQSKGWGVPSSVGAPPPASFGGSRIFYDQTPSRRVILLPAMGMNALSIFLGLFGLAFAAGGGFFLYAMLSGMPVNESPEGAGWVIAPVFILIGLGTVTFGYAAAAARGVVREDGDTLAIGMRVLGRDWGMKRFVKREIEQVELRIAAEPARRSGRLRVGGASIAMGSSPSTPGQEVLVRSDRAVARLGKNLTDEERQWLRDALTSMASGG